MALMCSLEETTQSTGHGSSTGPKQIDFPNRVGPACFSLLLDPGSSTLSSWARRRWVALDALSEQHPAHSKFHRVGFPLLPSSCTYGWFDVDHGPLCSNPWQSQCVPGVWEWSTGLCPAVGRKTAAEGGAGADRPGDERRCVFLSKVRLCS